MTFLSVLPALTRQLSSLCKTPGLLAVLLTAAVEVKAQSSSDWKTCLDEKASADRRVSACTSIIQSGNSIRESLPCPRQSWGRLS